jgi:CHRD domain-containing protein
MKRIAQAVLLAAVILVTMGAADPAARTWTARLTGGEQNPPVQTRATGSASVWLVAFGDSTVHYKIRTSLMTGVTMAHLHSGAKGQNGPIVVTLETPKKTGNAMISQGKFHASDLAGPLQGMDLRAFVASCDSGNVYVNVHTEAHTDGEIRGQLHHAANAARAAKKKPS